MAAIQAIRSITDWLYWQPPIPGMPATQTSKKLLQLAENSTQSNSPSINKLKEAVAARQQSQTTRKPEPKTSSEYWTPSQFILPESPNSKSDSKSSPSTTFKKPKGDSYNDKFVAPNRPQPSNPYEQGVPVGMAIVAAIIVQLQLANTAGGGIDTHVGGSMLVDVINSSWLQVILAGITWYLIGTAAVEIIAAFRIKSHDTEE